MRKKIVLSKFLFSKNITTCFNLCFYFFTAILIIISGCTIPNSSTGSTSSNTITQPAQPTNELTIQESSPAGAGFLGSAPGLLQNAASCTGFTGSGYIGSNSGLGANINWSVNAEIAGDYQVCWRYAFGGNSANKRDGKIVVNGAVIATLTSSETGGFEFTATAEGGKWNVYKETKTVTIPLIKGDNHIRLEAALSTGLANIDYIKISSSVTSALLKAGSSSVTTYHPITISVKTAGTGTASISPVKDYYAKGESVTATASAADGYYLSAWTGYSSTNPYSFTVTGDMKLVADFTQAGLANSPELFGYASIQNDFALAYIITGGAGATPVTVTTLTELTTALAGGTKRDIIISGLITTPDPLVSASIGVPSNTTLRGDGTGHLKNIELKVNTAENVIIRDLILSEVIAWDAYKGAGNDCLQVASSKYIWIHHCTFYSNLNAGGDASIAAADYKDYYDGLLDIKNQSAFITVSWCVFKDHWKACLISSGDGVENAADAAIRVTFHHNYFLNCISRMPLLRFGKAHIYNNYFYNDGSLGESSSSCVNSRNGAEVYVENNYFKNMKDTVGFYYETTYPTGYWNVYNNYFDNCTGDQTITSTCSFTPPYTYTAESVTAVPASVASGAGVRNPVP